MTGNDWLIHLSMVRKRREQAGSCFELLIPELTVYPGEFVAIVGESGCGKSTLLDLLGLISRPDDCTHFQLQEAGKRLDIAAMWNAGREADLAKLRCKKLGYVLQTGGLLPYLSVRDNLRLPCRLAEVACDGVLETMAKRIGIGDCLDRRPDKLSGGQRQRAAILRALLHRPQLVLADEPTAAVDGKRAEGILAQLRTIAQDEGSAVILVTHDLKLVQAFADRSYTFELESTGHNRVLSTCRKSTESLQPDRLADGRQT